MLLLPPGFLAIHVCALGVCYCSLSADMAVDKTAEKHFPKCGVGHRGLMSGRFSGPALAACSTRAEMSQLPSS